VNLHTGFARSPFFVKGRIPAFELAPAPAIRIAHRLIASRISQSSWLARSPRAL